MMPLGSARARQ